MPLEGLPGPFPFMLIEWIILFPSKLRKALVFQLFHVLATHFWDEKRLRYVVI